MGDERSGRWLRDVGWGLVGAVSGALVMGLGATSLPSPPVHAEPEPAEPGPPIPPPPSPSIGHEAHATVCVRSDPQPIALRQARAALERMSRRLERHEGAPLLWEAHHDPAMRNAEGMARAAREALPGVEVAVSCEEVPCLITWEEARSDGKDWVEVRRVLESRCEGCEIVGDVHGSGDHWVATIGAVPPDIDTRDPEVQRRLRTRQTRLTGAPGPLDKRP